MKTAEPQISLKSPQSLAGCGTALVTPFTPDGAVDETALRGLVKQQLDAGVHVLVPCGSTGEAATLTLDEHVRVVAITAQEAAGRVPVVAGAGSSDTQRSIALARECQRVGATHVLLVAPMYNKPPQRGMMAHFRAVADAVSLPVLLYNVPGRTASNVAAATTLAMAADDRFVGIKEASGNMEQVDHILQQRPDHFLVLSGDDASTLPFMAMGADGVISVVSNVFPAGMVQLVRAVRSGDLPRARALHAALTPFMHAAFIEANPIPVKAALAHLGVISPVVRLPLVPLDPALFAVLTEAMERTRGALASLGVH